MQQKRTGNEKSIGFIKQQSKTNFQTGKKYKQTNKQTKPETKTIRIFVGTAIFK